jgi:hypothetical protein
MKTKSLLYGFLAEFDNPEALKECIHHARAEGFRHIDAYTPFPVEGVAEALEIHHTSVPLIVLIGGCLGALTGAVMQYFSSVYDYPMNIGGRPFDSWPSFVIITFELTILFAGLFSIFGMLALNGLPEPHHPLFNEPRFDRATQDRFFFSIEVTDPRFDRDSTWEFLLNQKPEGVYAVHDLPW